MKQAISMLLILLLAAAAANLGHTAQALSQIEQSVIRLHILADSDSTADQTNKLLVRDALLESAADWIPADADFAAGCTALRRQLPAIRKTAEDALRAAGCSDSVDVSLEETAFPARKYGEFTLPAGDYQALRVEIGKAEGQNWWCVMYPVMCIPAAEQKPEEFLSEDACSLALHPEEYEIRLKCVDTARAAVRWIRQTIEQAEAASPAGETVHPCSDSGIGISSRSHCCSRIRCYCRSRSHCRSTC